jgi:hypothetical protein
LAPEELSGGWSAPCATKIVSNYLAAIPNPPDIAKLAVDVFYGTLPLAQFPEAKKAMPATMTPL